MRFASGSPQQDKLNCLLCGECGQKGAFLISMLGPFVNLFMPFGYYKTLIAQTMLISIDLIPRRLCEKSGIYSDHWCKLSACYINACVQNIY